MIELIKEKLFTTLNLNCTPIFRDGKYYIANEYDIYSFDVSTLSYELLYEGEIDYFQFDLNQNILFQKENGNDVFVMKNGDISRINGNFYLYKSFLIENGVLTKCKENGIKKVVFINSELEISECSIDFPALILNSNNTCINHGGGFIYAYKLKTGEQIWKRNFKEYLDTDRTSVSGNIIPIGKNFFLSLSGSLGSKKSGLFLINGENGKVIKKHNDIGGFWHLINGKLFAKSYDILVTMDPEIFALERTSYEIILKPHLLNFGIQNSGIEIAGKYFAFISNPSGGDNWQVGVLDLEKRDLVWHWNIEKEVPREVHLHENKLYVLMSNGNLYKIEDEF